MQTLNEQVKQIILTELSKNNYNVVRTAKVLDINRNTIYKRIGYDTIKQLKGRNK